MKNLVYDCGFLRFVLVTEENVLCTRRNMMELIKEFSPVKERRYNSLVKTLDQINNAPPNY